MTRDLLFRSLGALLACCAGPSLFAHDDPGKVLDFEPAYQGPGFRRANPGSAGNLLDFGSVDVTLESWLTLPMLDNASGAMDCWGYTSPSGREYAIIGTTSGTVFVEVTDPGNAQFVQAVPGNNSGWRDMKTFGEYCYSVSESGSQGLQVIDLSNIDSGSVQLVNTVNNVAGNSHNVALDPDSGFVYRCGVSSTGVAVYDLNVDPVNPPFVGFWSTTYVHDLQVKTMPSGPYAGRELAFMNTPGGQFPGLTVVDFTDKANPVVLGGTTYPGEAYSHQGWLSEDLQRFYVNDEQVVPAPTIVINVSDPANPFWENTFTNGLGATAHNCFVAGDYLYAANYSTGLRVFDLGADPLNPPEVGSYDTYPANNGSGFVGLWGCYPFFPSGTVIGSDRSGGLFVWSIGSPDLEVDPIGVQPTSLLPMGGATAQAGIVENVAGTLDPTSPTLVIDLPVGADIEVPLVNLGAGVWEGTFPALPCSSGVQYSYRAQTVAGETFETPATAAFVALSQELELTDAFEATSGWTVGAPGDTATTGIWELGDPLGTTAQPEDDHTPSGTDCWFTGQGTVGGTAGENDVDGGATTLISPVYDLTVFESPQLAYWLWYSNVAGSAPNADVFRVQASNDGGQSWVLLDEVGPAGPAVTGGWRRYQHDVRASLSVTAQMRFAFVAEDAATGSIVEAALDDLELIDIVCYSGLGSLACGAVPNSLGTPGSISATGSALVADDNFFLNAADLPQNQFGYFIVSNAIGFAAQPGGSSGNLCLGGGLGRFASQIQNSGTAGAFSIQVDLSALPFTPSVPVLPGGTYHFQAWHRDNVLGSTTSNFTPRVSVEFQ